MPPRHVTGVLVIGFLGVTLLAVATAAISAVTIRQAHQEAIAVATQGGRSTGLLGQVGQQVSLLWATVLQARKDAEGAASAEAEAAAQLGRLDRQLAATLRAVDGVISPEVRPRWTALQARLLRLQESVALALAFLHAGQFSRAEPGLVALASEAPGVLRDLDTLIALGQESRAARLAAAERELRWAATVEIASGVVWLLGSGVIWTAITRRLRRDERELASYTARIEKANQDLDAFAGRIAHDLKNAVAPLALRVDLARRSAASEQVLRLADEVTRGLQRGSRIIDSLLAFSRAGRAPASQEGARVRPVVQGVLDELGPMIEKRQVELTLDLGTCGERDVACAPGLFHLVLVNLIGNAVKFLAECPVRRVRVSALAQGEQCLFTVDDSGPGLAPELHDRIFEPFFRVPGTRAPGAGIGLATVKRIVDGHGGRVWVESAVGQGSTFRFVLPLAGLAKAECARGEAVVGPLVEQT